MRELSSGQQSDLSSRSSGALRGFITETRKRRLGDPDLLEDTAAPRRARNQYVFKNNVDAIQLVLRCWVESAQFCGCKTDIGRCPRGVRQTKLDKQLALENNWKPDQTDVSLVLGDKGVTFASDGERRRQRNLLRTACSGDDIYELIITSHWEELAQTGCRAFFIEDAYWVRREFGWFIKPFDRRATEACACDTCHGIKWLVRRMASLKKDHSLNVRSLMSQQLCPPSNLVYGGGVNAGGTEVMVYSNQCLRGECSACTMEWSAGLSMLQSCRSCSWHQFVMVEEGTDKKGKPRKNMRVRKQTGTGRELERRIASALPAYLLHHRDVVLCYHATRQAMRSGYAMWVDYSSRMTICNTFNPQSSEMTPQEIGAFIAVTCRPFGSKPDDGPETKRDADGRVKEWHVVLYDYNPGGGERAINTQSAVTGHACLVLIWQHERRCGIDIAACGHTWKLISDNCCADLKCADHFGALDTFVNPSPDTSVPEVLALQQSLDIHHIVRGYVAAKHGKHEVDSAAVHHRNECDKITLNWSPDGDVPEGEVEGAEHLCRHMQETTQTEMKRTKRARLTERASASEDRSVNAVTYHFLSVAAWQRITSPLQHYETLQPTTAMRREGFLGSSTFHEVRLDQGHREEVLARDTLCGCGGCSATPPSTCLLTHCAGPLSSARYKLKPARRRPRRGPAQPAPAPSPPMAPVAVAAVAAVAVESVESEDEGEDSGIEHCGCCGLPSCAGCSA